AHDDPEHECERREPERPGGAKWRKSRADALAQCEQGHDHDREIRQHEPQMGRAQWNAHAGLVLDVQEEERDGECQGRGAGIDPRACDGAHPNRKGFRHGHAASLGIALLTMTLLMRSRLFWRRSAAAAGIYASVVLGFFGTVIAAHAFSTRVLGLYAIVIAATGFFQTLLDLTIEEALVQYEIGRASW